MSYVYRILNDRPHHFYPLVAGGSAWNDATGRTNGAVVGTPTEAPPLVVGGGNAFVMDGSNHFRFQSELFYLDSPTRPFSLEAWFKPISVTGPKGIVGHNGQDDGLQFDGESISFTTLHGAAGPATARYYPSDTNTSFYVLGVHTESRNELYVNGVLVDAVDLTPEQLLSDYTISSAPGYLYAGHRSGTVIIDAVAAYGKALTGRQAKLHFLLGRDVPDLRDVVSKRGGNYWTFTDDTTDVAFDFKFDTDAEWRNAQAASVRIVSDQLLPALNEAGETVAGTWIAGFILPSIIDPKVGGSKIEWDADGSIQVHTSMNNGTTWNVAENGREVVGLGKDIPTVGKSLTVRVTFTAGETDSIAKVRSLSVKIYRTRDSMGTINDTPVLFSGKVGLANTLYQPIEQHDRMGVEFYSNGYGTVNSLSGIRTLEFWVKANTTQATTSEWWHIFDYRNADGSGSGYLARNTLTSNWSASGGTAYINGKQTLLNSDFAFTPGRWYHVVFVMDAASTNRLLINNNFVGDVSRSISVGMFAAYPQAMTAAQATNLYNTYMGIPAQTVVEPSGLTIVDAPVDTVKLYSYDWSNVSSG